jgi:serine/threonine-protein kinase HipA
MSNRQAAVFVNERCAGRLRQEPGRYVFEYEAAYFAAPDAPAVSLTLPKSQRVHIAPVLFPFFSGLLTEGTNHSIQVRALQLDEHDEFSLLLATAQRQTIGAVTVREIL